MDEHQFLWMLNIGLNQHQFSQAKQKTLLLFHLKVYTKSSKTTSHPRQSILKMQLLKETNEGNEGNERIEGIENRKKRIKRIKWNQKKMMMKKQKEKKLEDIYTD